MCDFGSEKELAAIVRRIGRPDSLQHLNEFVGASAADFHVSARRFHLVRRPSEA
jgi:hypothetical protein